MKSRNHRWTQIHTDKTNPVVLWSICVYLCLSGVPLLAAVDGTVVNKTTGQPQPGATVTLYKLGQAGMESLESVKSGAQGNFHMDQTPQGPNLIQTAYDGVTYNHMLPPGSAAGALPTRIARWNRNNKNQQIPVIHDSERYAIRLAALLHDIGHG